VSSPDSYETALFANADYGFDLLMSGFRERVAAGEYLTTPQIGKNMAEFFRTAAQLAAEKGYTDDPVGDAYGYAIIHCATAIQRLIVASSPGDNTMTDVRRPLDWQEWPDADGVARSYWAEGSCGCCVYTIVRRDHEGHGRWGLYQSDRGRFANAIPSGLAFSDAKATAAEWDRDYHGTVS
jgi:hypothetical protein